MVDMAHIAGLVGGRGSSSPFGLADIITTTTHKTLRGTRGGLIFCRPELAKQVDSAVFPGIQGGALQHVVAGKAVTAEEACTEDFKRYIHAVVRNCKAMCDAFLQMGYKVVTGGTDNHLFLLDLTDTGPDRQGRSGGAGPPSHHPEQELRPQRYPVPPADLRRPHRNGGP